MVCTPLSETATNIAQDGSFFEMPSHSSFMMNLWRFCVCCRAADHSNNKHRLSKVPENPFADQQPTSSVTPMSYAGQGSLSRPPTLVLPCPAYHLEDEYALEKSPDHSPSMPPAVFYSKDHKPATVRDLLPHHRVSSLQISSVKPSCSSGISEDAPSDFSQLTKQKGSSLVKSTAPGDENGKPRTLASMSIAKLTSGIADGGFGSR